MGTEAYIDVALHDRHEALRRALDNAELAMTELEAAGGRVGEEPKRGTRAEEESGPRLRVFFMPPLRQLWTVCSAEVIAHLDREASLLPALARGLTDGRLESGRVQREVTALMAEHELLYSRMVQVRKAFLGVAPLRCAFARVEEEFEVHAKEQDTGVFYGLLQRARSGEHLSDTPTSQRYHLRDPTPALRANLSQPPPPPRRRKRHWTSWFKKAFSIQGPAVRY